jgi:hypothetical protein
VTSRARHGRHLLTACDPRGAGPRERGRQAAPSERNLHTEAGQYIGLLPAIRQRKRLVTAESGSGSLRPSTPPAPPRRCGSAAGEQQDEHIRPFASEDVRRRPGMGAGE